MGVRVGVGLAVGVGVLLLILNTFNSLAFAYLDFFKIVLTCPTTLTPFTEAAVPEQVYVFPAALLES